VGTGVETNAGDGMDEIRLDGVIGQTVEVGGVL
jgi:hypothetical protein